MTDKELLELAAKAADYRYWQIEDIWNPLIDDGDALRLAVKLDMFVDIKDGFSGAQVIHKSFCSEEHKGDPCAATRLAIVRAAAEIGKEMK